VTRRTVRSEHIGFVQQPTVDGDASVRDLDLLAWQPDDALEKHPGRIARVFEDDDIATPQRLDGAGDGYAVPIGKRWSHRIALDPDVFAGSRRQTQKYRHQ
jgi:hypothetical protein